jgi:putative transcriptional regulator
MASTRKAKGTLEGKARMRSEIVEAMAGLDKIGVVSDAELERTTLRMLGRAELPRVADLSPAEIAKVRERAGVSQAVLASFLNVAVSTVSQWERGERRPTGAALEPLHVVRTKELDAVR